jgi:predicted RNase H-like HicB family nuclease
MTTYVALIHKDPDSDYGVSFPDLPGCITAGSTLDEAITMAKEALALHVEGLLEDNEVVPAPTPAEQIDRDDALLVTAVEVPDNLKVERINVTVPALALLRFDAFAERHSMTRSGLLVEAAQRWIAQENIRGELQNALGARDLDQTSDELTERLLRLAQELEKTVRAMMEHRIVAQTSEHKERA